MRLGGVLLNRVQKLKNERRGTFYADQVVKAFAADAMRTIALAYKDFDRLPEDWSATTSDSEKC